ncbi:MAG: recombinase family protein, partial [Spirochaetaceae bacterium]|nr:recombinase family protein [Spirochaetaceae bacterium]
MVGDRSLTAVLYARVSTKEQEREGFSIPAQCRLLRSYADRRDYQIVREFIDVETAKQSGRTHFTKMIRFLEEHPDVRIILCEKTDRLYRNFKDYVTLDELDLTLIFVKEGSVLNKRSRSHEKFIHGIKVLMAKNYIDNLSEETRKGMLEKAEEGEFPAYAPLGYQHDKANKTIEIDKERASIIRKMFEQYATGKFSLRRLEVLAAQRGLTTRKGNRLARSSVANILKNPFYTGDFLWNGKQYQGKHPTIIDKELFQRVQAVSSQRNDTRATSHRFAYSGLLKCAHCGCSITAEIKKGRYIYYHCTFDKGACGGAYVREENLEQQFEAILSEFHFSETVFDWMREALHQNQREKAEFHNQAIEALNTRYAKLQNRIDQIYLDKLDGEIEEAFYRRNITEWRSEQAQVREKIACHEKADQNYIEQGIKLLEIARNAAQFYQTQEPTQQAELLGFMMPGSFLEHKNVMPVFKPPFDIIHQMAIEAREATKKAAPQCETACPIQLPRLDEFRT